MIFITAIKLEMWIEVLTFIPFSTSFMILSLLSLYFMFST